MFYYEQMFNTALSGIMSAGLMSTILTVAYGILLASLLFSAYEAWTKGGDVRALGVASVKYLALGALFMNDGAVYERVFRDVLGAFNQISHTMAGAGPSDVFNAWRNDLFAYGATTGTFLNLVTAGHASSPERPPLIDRHDFLPRGVCVVRSLLFALWDDPVRHGPVSSCLDAQLWAGLLGTAIRDKRHDLRLVGFDLRHLLPPGDRDQCKQHGGAHVRQQFRWRSRRGVARSPTRSSECPILSLHPAHSGPSEADCRRGSWWLHADCSGSCNDDGSVVDVGRGGS